MGTLQFIILGGIVGVFAISQMSEAMIHRHSVELDPATQQRIYRREAHAALWWRGIEAIAIVMMVLGVLKAIGMVVLSKTQYGIPLMASGLSVYCVASILRSWHCSRVYAAEASGTPARNSARAAAVLTTLSEVALAGAVCWYVFFHMNAPKTPAPTPTKPPAVVTPTPGTSGGPATANKQWLDHNSAVLLLGQSDDYLEYLVLKESVRTRVTEGKVEYLAHDITSEKDAGLLNEDDMKLELKQLRDSKSKPTQSLEE